MPITFRRAHQATNLGLARFGACWPLFLRVGLLLLFGWYLWELFGHATIAGKLFLGILAVLVGVAFLAAMVFTYIQFDWAQDAAERLKTPSIWPYILVNVLTVLIVAAIGDWKTDTGLLGFTQRWVERIGIFPAQGGK